MKVLVLYENDAEREEAILIATRLARAERTRITGGEKRAWGGSIVRTVPEDYVHEPRILTRVADCNEVLQSASALATDIALGRWERVGSGIPKVEL